MNNMKRKNELEFERFLIAVSLSAAGSFIPAACAKKADDLFSSDSLAFVCCRLWYSVCWQLASSCDPHSGAASARCDFTNQI